MKVFFPALQKQLLLLTALAPLALSAFAQDTLPPVADSAQPAKETIKANLKTDDPTPPKVYHVNIAGTLITSAVATAANIIAVNNVLHNKTDLTVAEVQAAKREKVPAIDRWALNFDPSKRDHFYNISDKSLTVILAGSAATVLLNKKMRKDWLRLGLMFYQTQFLTFTFYDFSPLGPLFQNRLRPVVYYDYFTYDQRKGGNQKNSFYSGHMANATAATFFAVKTYLDYHPEMKSKRFLLYGLASLPPFFTGYMRMKALAHFPTDVLTGYVIGGVFGILIPQLHKIKSNRMGLSMFGGGQQGSGLRLTVKLGKQSGEANDLLQ